MRINKRNLIIYGVGLLISVLLLGLYFINPQNPWCTISVSVGASGIGAVILAWLIEWSNEKTRAEHRKTVRIAKFHWLDYNAIRLLERIVFSYFKKRENIFKSRDKDVCYKITFDEIWNELYKQEEYIESLLPIENQKVLSAVKSTDNELRRRCKNFTNHVSNRLSELITFEAVGFFDSREIELLREAGALSWQVVDCEESLAVEELEALFKSLADIKEFKYLKTIVFYYKGRKVDYLSSQKMVLKESYFSEEDRKNAVSALEREEYPAISSNS